MSVCPAMQPSRFILIIAHKMWCVWVRVEMVCWLCQLQHTSDKSKVASGQYEIIGHMRGDFFAGYMCMCVCAVLILSVVPQLWRMMCMRHVSWRIWLLQWPNRLSLGISVNCSWREGFFFYLSCSLSFPGTQGNWAVFFSLRLAHVWTILFTHTSNLSGWE